MRTLITFYITCLVGAVLVVMFLLCEADFLSIKVKTNLPQMAFSDNVVKYEFKVEGPHENCMVWYNGQPLNILELKVVEFSYEEDYSYFGLGETRIGSKGVVSMVLDTLSRVIFRLEVITSDSLIIREDTLKVMDSRNIAKAGFLKNPAFLVLLVLVIKNEIGKLSVEKTCFVSFHFQFFS